MWWQQARVDCRSSQQPQQILTGLFDLVMMFKTKKNYLTIGLQKRKGGERDLREEG